jgi:hypothetical protein
MVLPRATWMIQGETACMLKEHVPMRVPMEPRCDNCQELVTVIIPAPQRFGHCLADHLVRGEPNLFKSRSARS